MARLKKETAKKESVRVLPTIKAHIHAQGLTLADVIRERAKGGKYEQLLEKYEQLDKSLKSLNN